MWATAPNATWHEQLKREQGKSILVFSVYMSSRARLSSGFLFSCNSLMKTGQMWTPSLIAFFFCAWSTELWDQINWTSLTGMQLKLLHGNGFIKPRKSPFQVLLNCCYICTITMTHNSLPWIDEIRNRCLVFLVIMNYVFQTWRW